MRALLVYFVEFVVDKQVVKCQQPYPLMDYTVDEELLQVQSASPTITEDLLNYLQYRRFLLMIPN